MELANRRILVTGGAGFIGSNLVDALVKAKNDVVVLDDFSTGKPENLAAAESAGRVKVIRGSILDEALVAQQVAQADVIFHLAVQCLRVCFDKPHMVHHVNATGTLNLLEQSIRRTGKPLERFIYVSSSEVYGTAKTTPMAETHPLEPTTVYGASKLAGELYTQAYHITYGLPAMILRPFNTYGYREHYEGASGEVIPRFVVRILNNLPPIIFGSGEQTRDFTFVTDTVEGLIRAASTDTLLGQAVNIAYGQEVNIKTIAEMLLQVLGREDLGIQWEPARPADVDRHYADISKLVKHTGFKPAVAIEEGLERYITWFKKHYPQPEALLADCQLYNWKTDHATSVS